MKTGSQSIIMATLMSLMLGGGRALLNKKHFFEIFHCKRTCQEPLKFRVTKFGSLASDLLIFYYF